MFNLNSTTQRKTNSMGILPPSSHHSHAPNYLLTAPTPTTGFRHTVSTPHQSLLTLQASSAPPPLTASMQSLGFDHFHSFTASRPKVSGFPQPTIASVGPVHPNAHCATCGSSWSSLVEQIITFHNNGGSLIDSTSTSCTNTSLSLTNTFSSASSLPTTLAQMGLARTSSKPLPTPQMFTFSAEDAQSSDLVMDCLKKFHQQQHIAYNEEFSTLLQFTSNAAAGVYVKKDPSISSTIQAIGSSSDLTGLLTETNQLPENLAELVISHPSYIELTTASCVSCRLCMSHHSLAHHAALLYTAMVTLNQHTNTTGIMTTGGNALGRKNHLTTPIAPTSSHLSSAPSQLSSRLTPQQQSLANPTTAATIATNSGTGTALGLISNSHSLSSFHIQPALNIPSTSSVGGLTDFSKHVGSGYSRSLLTTPQSNFGNNNPNNTNTNINNTVTKFPTLTLNTTAAVNNPISALLTVTNCGVVNNTTSNLSIHNNTLNSNTTTSTLMNHMSNTNFSVETLKTPANLSNFNTEANIRSNNHVTHANLGVQFVGNSSSNPTLTTLALSTTITPTSVLPGEKSLFMLHHNASHSTLLQQLQHQALIAAPMTARNASNNSVNTSPNNIMLPQVTNIANSINNTPLIPEKTQNNMATSTNPLSILSMPTTTSGPANNPNSAAVIRGMIRYNAHLLQSALKHIIDQKSRKFFENPGNTTILNGNVIPNQQIAITLESNTHNTSLNNHIAPTFSDIPQIFEFSEANVLLHDFSTFFTLPTLPTLRAEYAFFCKQFSQISNEHFSDGITQNNQMNGNISKEILTFVVNTYNTVKFPIEFAQDISHYEKRDLFELFYIFWHISIDLQTIQQQQPGHHGVQKNTRGSVKNSHVNTNLNEVPPRCNHCDIPLPTKFNDVILHISAHKATYLPYNIAFFNTCLIVSDDHKIMTIPDFSKIPRHSCTKCCHLYESLQQCAAHMANVHHIDANSVGKQSSLLLSLSKTAEKGTAKINTTIDQNIAFKPAKTDEVTNTIKMFNLFHLKLLLHEYSQHGYTTHYTNKGDESAVEFGIQAAMACLRTTLSPFVTPLLYSESIHLRNGDNHNTYNGFDDNGEDGNESVSEVDTVVMTTRSGTHVSHQHNNNSSANNNSNPAPKPMKKPKLNPPPRITAQYDPNQLVQLPQRAGKIVVSSSAPPVVSSINSSAQPPLNTGEPEKRKRGRPKKKIRKGSLKYQQMMLQQAQEEAERAAAQVHAEKMQLMQDQQQIALISAVANNNSSDFSELVNNNDDMISTSDSASFIFIGELHKQRLLPANVTTGSNTANNTAPSSKDVITNHRSTNNSSCDDSNITQLTTFSVNIPTSGADQSATNNTHINKQTTATSQKVITRTSVNASSSFQDDKSPDDAASGDKSAAVKQQ